MTIAVADDTMLVGSEEGSDDVTSTPGGFRRATSDGDVSWRSRYEAPNGRTAGVVPRLWDFSYLTGTWRDFPSDHQAPRYRAVATAIGEGPTVPGAILDIGCGNGVLAHYLSPAAVARYVGVDISGVAVVAAQQACAGLGAEFLVADVRSWEPHTTAAVLVFNESLYYLLWPVQVVRRYAAGLHPGGVIVVSMYHQRWLRNPMLRARTDFIWKRLARSFRMLDVRSVVDGHGQKRYRVATFATNNES
jgi:SAM-dependent methyltransferase